MTTHPIDTEALRRLADAATEGPWMFDRDQSDGWMVVFGGNGHPHGYSIIGANEYLEPADAEFIAAARTALPALLDALQAAEHRATRAEAQSEARRINGEYWKERELNGWEVNAALKTDLAYAEARIRAVRELHAEVEGLHCHTVCSHRSCLDDSGDQHHYPCPTIRTLTDP